MLTHPLPWLRANSGLGPRGARGGEIWPGRADRRAGSRYITVLLQRSAYISEAPTDVRVGAGRPPSHSGRSRRHLTARSPRPVGRSPPRHSLDSARSLSRHSPDYIARDSLMSTLRCTVSFVARDCLIATRSSPAIVCQQLPPRDRLSATAVCCTSASAPVTVCCCSSPPADFGAAPSDR